MQMDSFGVMYQHAAMQMDSFTSTRAMYKQAEYPDEILSLFDIIAYYKVRKLCEYRYQKITKRLIKLLIFLTVMKCKSPCWEVS